jgi:glycerol uptake facilitator-like aquaporin
MRNYRRNLSRVLNKNPHMAEAYAVGARTAAKAQRRYTAVVTAAVCVGAVIGALLARLVLGLR